MNAIYLTILLPALLLTFNKLPDPIFPDKLQIFKHTHAILCPISFIKIL